MSATPDSVISVRFYTDYPICNFKCPYCIAGHAPPEGRGPSAWDEARYLRIIENLCRVNFKANVRIGVGGEFFVSKTLVRGAHMLAASDRIAIINLITNLSVSPRQYERALEGIAREKIALVASFHPTEVSNAERWIAAALELSESYDLVTMSVAYPPLMGEMERNKARFAAAGLIHFVQPYIGEFEGRHYPSAYTPEERAILRRVIYSRHDFEFLLNLKRPGLCNAGFKYLYVDPLGQVRPCGGADHGVVLGDLSESPFIQFRDGPRPCPASACQCDTENVHTLDFANHYQWLGMNQHRYAYRFAGEVAARPWMDEWAISY